VPQCNQSQYNAVPQAISSMVRSVDDLAYAAIPRGPTSYTSFATPATSYGTLPTLEGAGSATTRNQLSWYNGVFIPVCLNIMG
jgi:hypothetical protein